MAFVKEKKIAEAQLAMKEAKRRGKEKYEEEKKKSPLLKELNELLSLTKQDKTSDQNNETLFQRFSELEIQLSLLSTQEQIQFYQGYGNFLYLCAKAKNNTIRKQNLTRKALGVLQKTLEKSPYAAGVAEKIEELQQPVLSVNSFKPNTVLSPFSGLDNSFSYSTVLTPEDRARIEQIKAGLQKTGSSAKVGKSHQTVASVPPVNRFQSVDMIATRTLPNTSQPVSRTSSQRIATIC